MAAPDRPGIFRARIFDYGVTKSKHSGTLQVEIQMALEALYYSGDWVDWKEFGQQVTGYFYPIKKDGTLNETTCDQLIAAIDWDGQSLDSLEHGDYSDKVVVITIKQEEYQGQQQFKVAWINPADWVPGIQRLNASELKTECNRFDQLLRARYGTMKKNAAVGKPAPPKAPAKPAPQVPVTASPADDDVPF